MSRFFWLTDEQVAKLASFFPKSRGKPIVDDRRVLSGMIFINRNGIRCAFCRTHKTQYSRWKRWCEKGIFAQMMASLAARHSEEKTVMIDATQRHATTSARRSSCQ